MVNELIFNSQTGDFKNSGVEASRIGVSWGGSFAGARFGGLAAVAGVAAMATGPVSVPTLAVAGLLGSVVGGIAGYNGAGAVYTSIFGAAGASR